MWMSCHENERTCKKKTINKPKNYQGCRLRSSCPQVWTDSMRCCATARVQYTLKAPLNIIKIIKHQSSALVSAGSVETDIPTRCCQLLQEPGLPRNRHWTSYFLPCADRWRVVPAWDRQGFRSILQGRKVPRASQTHLHRPVKEEIQHSQLCPRQPIPLGGQGTGTWKPTFSQPWTNKWHL